MNRSSQLLSILNEVKSPEELAILINKKWVNRYGTSSMSGNCGKLISILRDKMIESGYSGYIVSGSFRGFLGNHGWVETTDGKILDPSVQQYGDDLRVVVTLSDPQYKNYVVRKKYFFDENTTGDAEE